MALPVLTYQAPTKTRRRVGRQVLHIAILIIGALAAAMLPKTMKNFGRELRIWHQKSELEAITAKNPRFQHIRLYRGQCGHMCLKGRVESREDRAALESEVRSRLPQEFGWIHFEFAGGDEIQSF